MPFTDFSERLGVTQGRVDPASYDTADGDYALVLGADDPISTLAVADETARLALTTFDVEVGQFVHQVDESNVYRLDGTDPSLTGSWTRMGGLIREMEIGDHIQWRQTAEFDPAHTIVRFRGRVRMPAALPAGRGWELSFWLDGDQRAALIVPPGKTVDLSDFGFPVGYVTGAVPIDIRLELV